MARARRSDFDAPGQSIHVRHQTPRPTLSCCFQRISQPQDHGTANITGSLVLHSVGGLYLRGLIADAHYLNDAASFTGAARFETQSPGPRAGCSMRQRWTSAPAALLLLPESHALLLSWHYNSGGMS